MKKVLIVGARSFVGTSFDNWMKKKSNDYLVDTLDLRKEDWQDYDFSAYDAVFHVAGIAHADVANVSEAEKQSYYQVNTCLPVETAKLYRAARAEEKGQFIYMSSMLVYGDEIGVNKRRVITRKTQPNPSNFYGDSKLQAEIQLLQLETSRFSVAILRPPMIYGPNGKGNYQTLKKFALNLPIFPKIRNERSMLHIDLLSEQVKQIIESGKGGFYFPQDRDYVCTSEMVQRIAKEHGKKVLLIPGFQWLVVLLSYFPGKYGKLVNKAFGNLVYEKEMGEKSEK